MGGRVIVHSAEDFDAWLLAEGAGPPLEARLASTNDQP
jgi:hypothetical protein